MISQKTRSSLSISIGSILIVFGTFLLVAFASGYNIDFLHGQITTTGLALLNSNPSGANIKVNSKKLSQKTPYRLEGLKTGQITIEYTKPDYHDWKTSYFVQAKEVTFADYALLIPNNIQTDQIEQNIQISSTVNSLDASKVFAFSESPVAIQELRNNTQFRKVVEIPANPSGKPATKIQLQKINLEGSAMIVKAEYESGEPILYWLNTGNSELVNLSPFTVLESTDYQINPNNNRELYTLKEGKINITNVESRNVSTLNISNINSFNIDSSNIYTLENLTPAENGQFLVRYDLAGNNRYVIAQYNSSSIPWRIDLSKLHGQIEISLLSPEDNTLRIARLVNGNFLTSVVGKDIQNPQFSRNGRFISYTQADYFKTIDIEFSDRFKSKQTNILHISWLSDFQLLLAKTDGLYIIDYTGENLIKIPPNSPLNSSDLVSLNKNGKQIYFTEKSILHTYSLEPKGGLINFR